MGKMKNTTKNVNGECLGAPNNARKRKMWMHGKIGIRFWAFTCPGSQNMFFQNGCSTQFKVLPILFPFPCNNYFNQFLAEINDWEKTKNW